MTDAATVAIRGIAAGGDGVGTLPDGRTVFMPRTAPGDRVTVRDLRLHARFARAEVARLVEAGPDRVEPPCPHYVADRCGGCQLMHLSLGGQHAAKRRIVGDALRRIAKLSIDDPPLVAAPASLGYRSKVTFTVRGARIGFHRLGEAGRVFEVERCLLLEASLAALHERVRQARALLPPDVEQLVLRRDAEGGRHVIVRGGERAWDGGSELARAAGDGVVVWWHPSHGAARAVAGSDEPWPATVFEQVNPVVGAMVRELAVNESVGHEAALEGSPVGWDLYAGIGETTAMLTQRGIAVTSVERDPRAVELAIRRGPDGPVRLAGDVADRLARLPRPSLVLVNPPRAGMAEPVTAALARSGASRLVYVSCDPGTLARDLRRLGPRFRLTRLTAFDQFPQTAHLECVATLESS